MPNERIFALQNAAGARFGLNGELGVWLTEPEGLGYELSPPYGDLGLGFFYALDEELEPQGSVNGTLIFGWPAYANYRNFVDWVAAAGSLLLIYKPYGDEEYQKAVSVSYLQKGELDKAACLHVPAEFTSRSPWRRPIPTEITMDNGEDRPRARYSGRYPGRYGGDAAGAMSARIHAVGHIPGALLLRYTGAITGPEIRLTGAQSGKVYGICRLNGLTLAAGDVLELSTRPEAAYVRRTAADGTVTSLLPYVDISQDPYPRVPTDEDSVLTVTSDATFTGSAELLVYSYYRTV